MKTSANPRRTEAASGWPVLLERMVTPIPMAAIRTSTRHALVGGRRCYLLPPGMNRRTIFAHPALVAIHDC